jgi:pimeloyl-ACP methyl ester carboxylesterase
MRLDQKKLLCVVACSSLLIACSSKEDTMENPIGAGAGGMGAASGGSGGMTASGGQGGSIGNPGGASGGASGMGGASGAGAGGASGAGAGGAGGDASGGMGGAGGDTGDDPNAVAENPDGVDALQPLSDEIALPIVFVHGFAGSAQQYDSQAQRFAANGYPLERILDFDHDGAGFDTAGYANGVDDVVDKAIADFGVEQVYLVGHSRGTLVSSTYLGDAARAAKIAKYISLDGGGCLGVSVPCLEPTQASIPGQAHVEVATSAESFRMQYEFLVGAAPAVVDIVPQKAPVTLRGRAVHFPANTGRSGTTLEVWTLDDATGHRAAEMPLATFEIGADGNWGPVTVDSRKRYEFALVPTAEGSTHHLYMQRFLRDTNFVRLLSGDAESATRMNTNSGDTHSSLVLMRMREWYSGGDAIDTIEIGTTSPSAGDQAAVDAMRPYVGNATIGIHVHDAAASPGDSTLEPLPYFGTQAFQAGVDVFMPATEPPDGTITITNNPRGDASKPQVIRVPNWASSGHAMSVLFADYAQ